MHSDNINFITVAETTFKYSGWRPHPWLIKEKIDSILNDEEFNLLIQQTLSFYVEFYSKIRKEMI